MREVATVYKVDIAPIAPQIEMGVRRERLRPSRPSKRLAHKGSRFYRGGRRRRMLFVKSVFAASDISYMIQTCGIWTERI